MHSRQKPRAKARGRGGAPVGMMSQRRSRSAGQACGRKAQPGQPRRASGPSRASSPRGRNSRWFCPQGTLARSSADESCRPNLGRGSHGLSWVPVRDAVPRTETQPQGTAWMRGQLCCLRSPGPRPRWPRKVLGQGGAGQEDRVSGGRCSSAPRWAGQRGRRRLVTVPTHPCGPDECWVGGTDPGPPS